VDQQNELELIEREEREARLRVGEMRDRVERSEGEAATADQELLRKLEEEWERIKQRLHRARRASHG
jgi:hypothetical protein